MVAACVVGVVWLAFFAWALRAEEPSTTTPQPEAHAPRASTTTVAADAATSAPYQIEVIRQQAMAEAYEPTQPAIVGTSIPIVLRLRLPDGNPAADVPLIPIVVTQPEDVTEPIRVHPDTLRTNAAGEVRMTVRPGDKTGRYQILFFRPDAGVFEGPAARLELIAREPNWPTFLALYLAGGLAIFLYGLKLASDGLVELSGRRLRDTLAGLTRNPLTGLLAGLGLTLATQSSGATTLLLMTFLRARLLTFARAMGIVLGAAIGGTVTIQIISFDLARFALPGVAAGCALYLFGRHAKVRNAGLSLFGFGLVFLGMDIMTGQMLSLKSYPAFRAAVDALKAHPVWTVVVSALFTAAAQSTGATLGVVLALGRQGLLTLPEAVPFFFGASIGICATAITGSMGAPPDAKRLAYAHLLYKAAGTLLFLPLIAPLASAGAAVTAFAHGMELLPSDGSLMSRAIANTYTLFIVITASMTLPFVPVIERIMRRIIPDEPENAANGEMRTKYLDQHVLSSPPVALGSALREISRMGRFIEEMLREVGNGLFNKDPRALDFVHQRDNKVDFLNTQITRFLTQLTLRAGGDQESIRRATDLLFIVADLEAIGDILDKNIVPNAQKMILQQMDFSEEGKTELRLLHQKVSDRLSQMVIALTTSDRTLAEPVIEGFQALQEEGRRMHLSHLQRLRDAQPASLETSTVHLDVINYLMRIDFLTFDICLHIAGKVEEMTL